MQAVISGQAGVALLLEDQRLSSLHADTEEIVPRREREIPYLLGDATDLQFLENVELDEVIRYLEQATAQMDALHTALILLDGSLPSEPRQVAAEELQGFLEDEALAHFVESVLFSRPLTPDSDLPGALAVCTSQTEKTRSFLDRLASLQEVIAEAHFAWERIPTAIFGTDADRQKALSTAVREGLFRDLILSRAVHASVDQFLVGALHGSTLPRRREILLAWVAPLRDKTTAPASPSPTSLSAEPWRPSGRTTIGPAILIKGDLTGDEDLVIEGLIEGKVDLKRNKVRVGKSGKVTADIYGQVVTVEGEVHGSVFAYEMVTLQQSGVIRGNISAPRVVLEEGSQFKGSIDMRANDLEWSQDSSRQGQAQGPTKLPEAAAVKAAR